MHIKYLFSFFVFGISFGKEREGLMSEGFYWSLQFHSPELPRLDNNPGILIFPAPNRNSVEVLWSAIFNLCFSLSCKTLLTTHTHIHTNRRICRNQWVGIVPTPVYTGIDKYWCKFVILFIMCLFFLKYLGCFKSRQKSLISLHSMF